MYLLDTHALLWAAEDEKSLSERAFKIIRTRENILFVSMASAWEIFIKAKLGKLKSALNGVAEFTHGIERLSISLLPVTLEHCHVAANLPLHHRDPFDRLLIAQSKIEQLTLISDDPAIAHYDIDLLW